MGLTPLAIITSFSSLTRVPLGIFPTKTDTVAGYCFCFLGFPLALFDEFFSAACPELFWLFSAEFVDFVSPLDCFFFGVNSSPLVLSPSFDEFFPADFFLLFKGFFLLLVLDLPLSECLKDNVQYKNLLFCSYHFSFLFFGHFWQKYENIT